MKKTLMTLLIAVNILNAAGNSMPPMPPSFGANPTTAKVSKKSGGNDMQNKLDGIKGCSTLPPMIIFLPPPMEKDLIACRNGYNKPTNKIANEKLSKIIGKKVKIRKVEIEEGFREVYKITYSIKGKSKKLYKYCNSAISKCLK